MLAEDIRRFLVDTKMRHIDKYYMRLKTANPHYSKELLDLHMVYRSLRAGEISLNTLIQFLTQKGTAHAMFMIGYALYHRGSTESVSQAIPYFELYCKMGNPEGDGFRWIAMCHEQLYNYVESLTTKQIHSTLCLQNLQQSATVNHSASWIALGNAYNDGLCGIKEDLRAARHYYKLYCDSGATHSLSEIKQKLNTVELKLLDEFEVQLNKPDYPLAYELRVKHDRSGQQDLQKLIENDYSEVLDLPKVLCNIIVSYLLYKN